MSPIALLVVVALTSLAAAVLATRRLGCRAADARPALARALELVGAGVVFWIVNAGVTVLATLFVRRFVGFASLYAANDLVLLVLSLLQGVVFGCWRDLAVSRRAGREGTSSTT